MNDAATVQAGLPSARHWLAYRALLAATFRQRPARLHRLVYLVPGGLPNPVARDHAYLCSRPTHGWRRLMAAAVSLLSLGGVAFLTGAILYVTGASFDVLVGAVVVFAGLASAGLVLLERSRPLLEAARHGADRYVLNIVRHRTYAKKGAGMSLLAEQLEQWRGEVVALHARAAPLTGEAVRNRDQRQKVQQRKQRELVEKYTQLGFVVIGGDLQKRPLMVCSDATRPHVSGG